MKIITLTLVTITLMTTAEAFAEIVNFDNFKAGAPPPGCGLK